MPAPLRSLDNRFVTPPSRSLFFSISQWSAVSNMESARDLVLISLSVNRRDLIIANRRYAFTMRNNYFNYPLRLTTNELYLYRDASILYCLSFVKWYLRLLAPSVFFFFPTPFHYPLTFRIIHRLGLKSKIHNHSSSPLLSLSLFISLSLSLSFPLLSPGTFYYPF